MGGSTRSAAARSAAGCLPHVPIRTCVGCRRRMPKAAMLRLTAPDGTVEVEGSASGRAAYVCPDRRCVRNALRDGGARVARALRRRPSDIDVNEEALAAAVAASTHGDQRREE